MKKRKQTAVMYESPCVELFETAIERGFAGTTLNYYENPSMSYGDEREQWF
ncbi:MAG: hypothetical protein IIX59_03170 [Alistipes sp.]|jgi:hypothetical protein|nr:hypothetical protein [Alistipes sp.]MBQ1200955.1 hypothetical protein [Alistipes sp.]MBQ2418485.1 hypothetical protein [Alistipes sp.]